MPLLSHLGDLEDFSFFGGITSDTLEQIDDLFEAGSYPAGSTIIAEGNTGRRLYLITAGQVKISVQASNNGTTATCVLDTLERGATFGEMELLDTQARSATVTAAIDTKTVELTNMAFYQLFLRDPEAFRMIMMNLARDLSRRLREVNRRFVAAETNKHEAMESTANAADYRRD